MERLTTDNPQNNAENALNLAYAKDGWVHIRGIDEPFTDYIKKECRRNGCNLSEMTVDEVCDCVTECAFTNPQCPIFLLYMIATQAAELRARLAAYEESGLAPEDIPTGLQLANVFCALQELKKYEALGTLDELKALQGKVKKKQLNEQLTCEGCAYQKREAWNYESCIRCKRHWEDRYRRKPEQER